MRTYWPTQEAGNQGINDAIAAGAKRICVTSPTGGGKSLMMIRRVIDNHGNSTVYTHRKMLLRQMSKNLDGERVQYGIRAAGHRPVLSEPVQLSMVLTEVNAVLKRGTRECHDATEVHVDEAHNNATGSTLELLDRHLDEHDSVRIGWTATPLNIGNAYDVLVVAGKNSDLRECGAHVPAYHFGPDEPSKALIGDVKIGEGECGISRTKRGLFAKRVFGSVIENYNRLNPNRTPTLLFAPGVPESIWFCEQLNEAGITAAHIDGEHCWLDGELVKTSDEIKDEIAYRCESGDLKIVCNRFVLREGVDWPFIAHGIFATVFGSLTAYIQAGGRLLRAHDSMDKVIVQDHGGNYWRHASLNEDREWDLSYTNSMVNGMRMDAMRENEAAQPINCVRCNGIRMGGLKCQHCGHEYKTIIRRRPVLQVNGTLKPMMVDKFRKRRVAQNTPSMRKKWEGSVMGNMKNKPDRTLSQIAANFARLNDWCYPRKDFPYMPIKKSDWYRPIGTIDFRSLTQ